jgi:hypothetical protein
MNTFVTWNTNAGNKYQKLILKTHIHTHTQIHTLFFKKLQKIALFGKKKINGS